MLTNTWAQGGKREPGMPKQFIENLPPFKKKLGQNTIACIIEMHESKKMPFDTIAKELRIRRAKAKNAYDRFYQSKTIDIIKMLEERRKEIYLHYSAYKSSKNSMMFWLKIAAILYAYARNRAGRVSDRKTSVWMPYA